MAEITKAYREGIGASRFIGKQYGNADRVNGAFGAKWGEWFENGWFGVLEQQTKASLKDICEDGDAYIGLMRDKDGAFEYWIGLFMPEHTAVPDGFAHIDFPRSELGTCWVYGKEDTVYGNEVNCLNRLVAEGFEIGNGWCFERYACPRFTTPDEKGNIILDICFFVK